MRYPPFPPGALLNMAECVPKGEENMASSSILSLEFVTTVNKVKCVYEPVLTPERVEQS